MPVYQFHDDWHGEVMAEATSGGDVAGSYLGLHFPANDIPEQAIARSKPLIR
jgi:light-regulated signal transduction histidine kinase (bacteriophytochrome)